MQVLTEVVLGDGERALSGGNVAGEPDGPVSAIDDERILAGTDVHHRALSAKRSQLILGRVERTTVAEIAAPHGAGQRESAGRTFAARDAERRFTICRSAGRRRSGK